MSSLTIRGLKKSFGSVDILKGIDLEIVSGEFVVFVGPSGCGKSTLLRMVAGLEQISAGTIAIDGEVVNDLSPAERGIAMVFQSYALYPHMTVHQNMAFDLKMAGLSKNDQDVRVRKAAEMLQITPYLQRLPKQLSGGQRQRVAIGRAITRDPKVFLFDEPLSNLDAALRVATRIEIAKLKDQLPQTTMIYVTHDQVEAMTLADRIVVLNGGNVEQVGTPMELYHHPANRFEAGFIGSPAINFVPVTVEKTGTLTKLKSASGTGFAVPIETPSSLQGQVLTLGARPENLAIAGKAPALLRGTVTVCERLGELVMAYVDVGSDEQIIVKLPGDNTASKGDPLALSADPTKLHLFTADGKALTARATAAPARVSCA